MTEDKTECTFADLLGISQEEMIENSRIVKSSKKYIGLPLNKWPSFDLCWDLSADNHRFVLPSRLEEDFRKCYPKGLIVGEVTLAELHEKLIPSQRHPKNEFWSRGAPEKIARVILHWVEGTPLTPPLIGLYDGGLKIEDGYNRLAVCVAKNPLKIPILISPSEKSAVGSILKTLTFDQETS